MNDTIAFKILLPEELERFEREGRFEGSPADLADGFIHLSTAAQVEGTLAKHFAQAGDLRIVAVDLARAGEDLRWEPARDGQLFPHLYRALSASDAITSGPLQRDSEGRLLLPTRRIA